jgi:predicted lipoprotein with Yx(FWY)xxD motif
MKHGTTLFAGMLAAAVGLVVAYDSPDGTAEAKGQSFFEGVPVATPPGVTMQPLGKAQGYDLGKSTASTIVRDEIAYADLDGLTLYTWEEDPPGKATCTGECAKLFEPFLVVANANPFGDWSIIDRADGRQQWALKGQPLYTYVRDVDPGSVGGNSPANEGALRRNGAGKLVGGGYRGSSSDNAPEIEPMPAGWKPALAFPIVDIELPAGISVKEVPDATAFVLVDRHDHTLYAADEESTREAANCSTAACRQWQPLIAPELAGDIGDFSVVVRADGIRQWAYQGHSLYTYRGDLAPGYANGIGVDPRWSVAAVTRYYMPDGVSIQTTLGKGRVLATAEGMTLYRRDGYILQSGGGHSLRRGQPARPAVGRDIGTDARCDAGCEELWHPFVAGPDGQPSGFWSVATRPDGTRQWVYQGYALWTYEGDQKPGDMRGHDTYDIVVPDDPEQVVNLGTPMDAAGALWWSIAVP